MFDTPVDESVNLYCEVCEEEWHPRTFSEYQGVEPHGGMVAHYETDAFECPVCGREGEEIA